MTVMLPGLLMPWLASGIVAGSVIVVLFLCVCQGRKEKVSDHGMPGVVHRIDVDKPLLEKPHEENIRHSTHPEEGVHEKTRTVAERALPDIPRILQAGNSITDTDTDQTPDSGSECYATVNKPSGALPVVTSVQEKHFELAHNGRISGNRFSEHVENVPVEADGFSRSHTYAQVFKYTKSLDHKQAANSGMHFEETECQQSTSTARTSPSLPESELFRPPSILHSSFDDRDTQSFVSETTFSIAGQAVAGNIPSAEIPYMTPPPPLENIHGHSSLDDIQSPYTTISVREPLDRVKKQIVRQQMRQHPNRNPSTEEQEGLYTEVPDDQTYAEIDSGQTSTESSTTYDQIEPRIQDFPPDPPTVESLKTVAQAHSRQASIASVSSSGSGNDGSSVFRDISTLYSVVDKTTKQRQTIHVAENIDVHRFQDEDQKKVEDMYAKVCKKKSSASHSTSGILENLLSFDSARVVDDVFASPRSSWSPGTARTRSPPLLPPPLPAGHRLQVTLDADTAQTLTRRHSADPSYIESKYSQDKAEPGYASVGAHDSGDSSSYEKLPVDSDDPGYERIRKNFSNGDPHYEHIGQVTKSDHSSSDPGYEHVPGRRVEKSDSIEPGYERIRRLNRFDSDAVDPGYERVRRVKRDTENTDPDYDYIPNLTRNDSDCGEPGYETVNHLSRHNSDAADPGYERVKLKKPESGQVSRVAIKMDGSFVVQSVERSAPEDNIASFSKDFSFENYSAVEQRSFTSNATNENDDVVTVSETPEKISICINFKPSSEPIIKEPVTKPITEGINGDSSDHEQHSLTGNGLTYDTSVRIQTIAPSSSVSSGDCEDHSSCTATQNSTGYETASSGESMTSASGMKKRKIVLSSNTQEVTVSNSRGNTRKVSLQTEKNIWENGQQVYQEAKYSVQKDQES